MVRFGIILLLIVIIGVVGFISGFLTWGDTNPPCLKSSTSFDQWQMFYRVNKLNIHVPTWKWQCDVFDKNVY